MRLFFEVIKEMELKEPLVQEGWFSWFVWTNSNRRARLDRFLTLDD